jgi:hypothetical protein
MKTWVSDTHMGCFHLAPPLPHLQERALAEYQRQVDEISARNQAKVSDALGGALLYEGFQQGAHVCGFRA